jgi:PKD repeat protein
MGNSGQVSFSNISDTSTITPNIFIWELGNSGYPSSTIPTYTFAYNGTYSVSLLLYNYDAYCQNITTQTITVTNAAPSPCLVLNANFSYILSSNGYVNFSSTSTGIDTSSYYVWNFGDGTSFNYNTLSADTAITYFNNGIYSVYLEVTRNYLFNPDSLNQHATCYDTISIPITINNIPVCNASFTYSLGTNGQVSFYAASSGLSYNWSFGDAIGSASNVPNPSFIYHSNGTYTVFLQIQDSAGYFCGSSQAINIVNTNSCTPYVTYSLQQDTVPFTWDAYPYYSSQVASAIWYWGDGSSTTGLYTSHTYSSQGTYNICVKVFSSCGDSTTTCQNDSIYRLSSINTMIKVNIINSASTGISTVSKEDISLTIFPNPASNNIQIITSNNNSDIKFIDMLGQTVKHLSTKTQETTVDISNLMDGVYFVIITENGLNTSKRIIIYK